MCITKRSDGCPVRAAHLRIKDTRSFALHSGKTQIFPIAHGIKFLGFNFRLTPTGKVLMLINRKNVQTEKRKLRRVVGAVLRGEMQKDKADEMYRAWRNHAEKGDNKKAVEHMDSYYKMLYKGGI